MLGMPILDVTIGLLFTYLLLSLIITASNELVETLFKQRGSHLAKGILKMLGSDMESKFFKHGLIKGLCPNSWFTKQERRPSYLPPAVFVTTLYDLLEQTNTQEPKTIEGMKTRIKALADNDLRQALHALLTEAGDNLENFKKSLETWFNTQMDRVGGWYKRKVQLITMGLAFVLAVFANADSIVIASALWNDSALRGVMVAEAEKIIKAAPEAAKKPQPKAAGEKDKTADTTKPADQKEPSVEDRVDALKDSYKQLQGLGLPIGWAKVPANVCEAFDAAKPRLFGWLVTALAISLGAPFWFDMLSKVISIRSAVKPPPAKTTT